MSKLLSVEVQQLCKNYGSYVACKDISFHIQKGRLAGLIGPSGSGKTTILRMLAGLETPDSGDIYFDGRRVNEVPPQRRGIGLVFQNYALFRHMTVYENVAFGLTVQKKKKSEIDRKVKELLLLTSLQGMERRYPDQLSGGQRQRVAFARALAPNPRLLLLDEPFAAVDAKVRKDLRLWLKTMVRQVGVTTIFVTHDQEEAIEAADEIMIIRAGQLEQSGTPLDIYNDPHSSFVAQFVGDSNMISHPSALKGYTTLSRGARAMVRPELIDVGKERELSVPSAAERGIIRNVFFRGSRWLVEVVIETMTGSIVVCAYRSLQQEPLYPGDEVFVLIHRLYLFDQEDIRIVENSLKDDPLLESIL